MTPAQQTALEGLAGRALTPDEIAAIDVYLPDRNDVEIAKLLPPKVEVVSTEIGVGTILAVFQGLGGQFLDALETAGQTNRDIHWLLQGVILRGVFDAGNLASRAGMQQLAVAMPTFAAGINALLALAERSTPINFNAVSDALNVAEGRLILG